MSLAIDSSTPKLYWRRRKRNASATRTEGHDHAPSHVLGNAVVELLFPTLASDAKTIVPTVGAGRDERQTPLVEPT